MGKAFVIRDSSTSDNPFQRNSTLLGMVSAVALLTVLGEFTHWRSDLIPIYMLAFPVTFVVFARLFFGLRESRMLDDEPVSPGSGWHGYWDPRFPLQTAYEKAQRGDVSDFKRLAEEDQFN